MQGPAPSPPSREAAASLAAGTLVGGRFLIERRAGGSALGETLLARDEKTGKPIAVRILSAAFAADVKTVENIRAEVRSAAKLKHRSLVGTYGIGTHDNQCFVACEWVQGSPLSELIAKRNAEGSPLSARGAYNVIAHVCKALAQVHATTCHGALRPNVVWITKSGRVKVAELGLDLALARSDKWRLLPADEQLFLAPEVRAGREVGVGSDIFGLGATLYALLTGRAPSEPRVAPSQVHPDATPELDAVIARCLHADPQARFGSIDEFTQALLPLLAGTPEPDRLELGVDLEIDVDVALSMAPPAPGSPPRPVAAPVPAARAPSRPSQLGNGVAARDPLGGARVPAPAAVTRPKPQPEAELSALTAKLFENDAARWIAVKGGLDHGPFTARELVKLIVEGEILEPHRLLNMSTGDAKPLGEWSEFREFVEQYKLHKADADHAVALQKSTRIERTSNAAKFVILGGSLAVMLVAGGGYLMSRQAAQRRQAQHDVDLAEMLETGKVKVSGTAGILQARPHKAGAKHASAGSEHSGGGFTSYDDAMNQAMDLGDASKGGGEKQLRTADIEAVMNRRLNSLFGCVSSELRSGAHLGTVQIDMAILGSGQVAGASISTGSAGFKKCISAKVRQIGFPTFPAPRMGARYSFSVD
jgi:hypothetical protein